MQLTNKFYILYGFNTSQPHTEEDEVDRKLIYECDKIETATYIVAKIKYQM